jgi:hypothetical protein
MRQVVSILVGLIAGLAVFFLGHMITMSLYPLPDAFGSEIDTKDIVDGLSIKAYIVKAFTHILMCFTSGLTAALVAIKGKRQAGLIAGFIAFIVVTYRDFRYEYPYQYVLTDLGLCLIIGFSGVLLASRKEDRI